MPAKRPILVASDFSPASDVAMARAMQLSQATMSPLVGLHVIEEEPLWWVVKSDDLDPDEVRRELLHQAAADLRDQARQAAKKLHAQDTAFDPKARLGHPASLAAEVATELHGQLLVAGAHGHHAIRDWFIGTTAEKIAQESDVPVLVARIEPSHSYHRVVVAVDFSNPSAAALKEAVRWAPNARFTLVHAYETWFEGYIDAATYERIRQEQEDALYERLRDFAQANGITRDQEVDFQVISGYPSTAVVKAAIDARADLTVCGTLGVTGLRRLVLGSVAQHILRESKSDVLTVPLRG
ncbi:universal stress protein [Guyparkeria sp. 1SP6A2]|nr:universal stress protein [Guyparkeria sp. 1SP6A2]